MQHLFEVTEKNIQDLGPLQMPEVLRILLSLETQKLGIPPSSVRVSSTITMTDGGEDGRVTWEGGYEPVPGDYITSRNSLYQSKADAGFGPKKCIGEMFVSKTKLKPKIEEVLSAGGSYILFTKSANAPLCEQEIRKALKTRRRKYSGANIKVYGKTEITAWVNQHPSAVIRVKSLLGQRTGNAMSWKELSEYPEFQEKYIQDARRSLLIDQIRTQMIEARQSMRLVGPTSIGKCRLIIEAFRPAEDEVDITRPVLSDRMIYYNAHQDESPGLIDIVTEWRRRGLYGILVINNCPDTLHKDVLAEVTRNDSKLSLITLSSYSSIEPTLVQPLADETVKKIITSKDSPMPESVVNQLIRYAGGFPSYASLLRDAYIRNPEDGISSADRISERLLLNEMKNFTDNDMLVLQVCALFEQVGSERNGGDKSEAQILLEEFCGGLTMAQFKLSVGKFEQRGYILRRGRYIQVVPPPFAFYHAKKFWETQGSEPLQDFITNKEIRPRLAKAMFERFSDLRHIPEAEKIVESLVGAHGPFAKAEVLFSEEGSRLFCLLVEVNPSATLNRLKEVVENLSIDQLRQTTRANWNIIDAIEKLCFGAETFHEAAPLLLKFAQLEDINWNVGATRHFYQLFHILVPGTQASLDARIELIDELIELQQPLYGFHIVKALSEALESNFFSRSGGVEEQGGQFSKMDYLPRRDEIPPYFIAIIERLLRFASRNDDLGQLAKDEFALRIRNIFSIGLIEELSSGIEQIVTIHGRYWPKASSQLTDILNFDVVPDDAGLTEEINRLLHLLEPEDFSERMRLYVSKAPWWDPKRLSSSEDIGAERAREFAITAAAHLEELYDNLRVVFEGEQIQGMTFGEALGSILPRKEEFIDKALATLRQVMPEKRNISVLGGFLRAIQTTDPALVEANLEKIAVDEILFPKLVELTTFTNVTPHDVYRTVLLAQQGKIPAKDLALFSYWSVLSKLPPKEISKVVADVMTLGVDGAVVALNILMMYCLHEDEKYNVLLDDIRRIVMTEGMLTLKSLDSSRDGYHFEKAASKLFSIGRDTELAIHIASEIVRIAKSPKSLNGFRYVLDPIVRILFEQYSAETLPIIGEALLETGGDAYKLFLFLSDDYNENDEHFGLLFHLPQDTLFQWCKDNSPKAPELIAKEIPTIRLDNGQWVPHQLGIDFIKEFGEVGTVVNNLSLNLMGIGWMGSPVPKYEGQKKFLQILASSSLRTKTKQWVRAELRRIQEEIEQQIVREQESTIGIVSY